MPKVAEGTQSSLSSRLKDRGLDLGSESLVSVASLREHAERCGFSRADAMGLAELVQRILDADQRDRLSVTDIKRNPGKLLAELSVVGPQRIADARRKDPPEAMLLATEDIVSLVEIVIQLITPRYATGADLFARFAREGPPGALALEPPKEAPYSPYVWPATKSSIRGD